MNSVSQLLMESVISLEVRATIAALRCRRAKISDKGFIRLMSITTRLVLDRMVERKARNKFNQHVHETISDMSRKQWLALTVLIRSRKLRRRFPCVSDNESSGSILSFYNLILTAHRFPLILILPALIHSLKTAFPQSLKMQLSLY
ncbi:uncharacterized protein [Watersipora subatra]|uniref:uncharacterized protein n=1 Tax=Watersipora subatra TaxID=2589382 RepID=UPI00355B447A